MKDKDIILYNRVGKLERDLSSVGGGEFDPSTYDMKSGFYHYEPLFYSAMSIGATASASSVYPTNFATTNSFTQGGMSFSVSLSYLNSTTYITKPALSLNPSTLGTGLVIYNPLSINSVAAIIPYKITEQIITFVTSISFELLTSEIEYTIGLGSFSLSAGDWGGSGIFFNIGSNSNSGLLRIGRIASGVKTFYNTSIALNVKTAYELKIILNKKTNIANFYIDNIDIGTTIDITIFNNIYLSPSYIIKSLSTLGSGNRRYAINSIYIEQKY